VLTSPCYSGGGGGATGQLGASAAAGVCLGGSGGVATGGGSGDTLLGGSGLGAVSGPTTSTAERSTTRRKRIPWRWLIQLLHLGHLLRAGHIRTAGPHHHPDQGRILAPVDGYPIELGLLAQGHGLAHQQGLDRGLQLPLQRLLRRMWWRSPGPDLASTTR